MSKLALLGGDALGSQHIKEMTTWPSKLWPTRNELTAEKLKELYLSNNWAFGSQIEMDFAQAFADYHGAKHGIFMANGTVTLQCALAACGVGPGDEVIVPPHTWMATALAVHYVGATPVFVDTERDTLCLDPEKVSQAINEKTKAIIPVHLYSSMADMDRLMAIAKKHDLRVIEDCAHMHGGMWDGKGVGTLGDVGSFSCQNTKTMGSGEGGICITDDPELADLIFRMSHIGYSPGVTQGQAQDGPREGFICHNFRSTGLEALILNEQLKGLEILLSGYNSAQKYLEARLGKSTKIRFQAPGRQATVQGHYAWAMIFDDPSYADISIDVIREAMRAEGLMVTATWAPVYDHKLFNLGKEHYRIAKAGCHVTEEVMNYTLVLLHQTLGLGEKDLAVVADIIEKVLNHSDDLRSHEKASQLTAKC